MNYFFATGRVGAEPKLTETQSGVAKLSFPFMTNSRIKEGDDYLGYSIQAVIYGGGAQRLSESLSKGSPITLTGDLGTRPWVDENGEKQYYTFLRIDKYENGENVELSMLRKSKNNRQTPHDVAQEPTQNLAQDYPSDDDMPPIGRDY